MSGETPTRTADSVIAVAEERGLKCIFPTETELVLDIDEPRISPEQNLKIAKIIDTLDRNGYTVSDNTLVTTSKSGNKHFWLKIDPEVSADFRITIQAAMGSDPVKEILSWIRDNQMHDAPIAMFETPEEAKRVSAWRRKKF